MSIETQNIEITISDSPDEDEIDIINIDSNDSTEVAKLNSNVSFDEDKLILLTDSDSEDECIDVVNVTPVKLNNSVYGTLNEIKPIIQHQDEVTKLEQNNDKRNLLLDKKFDTHTDQDEKEEQNNGETHNLKLSRVLRKKKADSIAQTSGNKKNFTKCLTQKDKQSEASQKQKTLLEFFTKLNIIPKDSQIFKNAQNNLIKSPISKRTRNSKSINGASKQLSKVDKKKEVKQNNVKIVLERVSMNDYKTSRSKSSKRKVVKNSESVKNFNTNKFLNTKKYNQNKMQSSNIKIANITRRYCPDCNKTYKMISKKDAKCKICDKQMVYKCMLCKQILYWMSGCYRHVNSLHILNHVNNKKTIEVKSRKTIVGASKIVILPQTKSKNKSVLKKDDTFIKNCHHFITSYCKVCKKKKQLFNHKDAKCNLCETNLCFKCQICKQEFSSKKLIYQHFREHHLHDVQDVKSIFKNNKESMLLVKSICKNCSKTYALSEKTIEKCQKCNVSVKFQCRACKCMYVTLNSIFWHMRTKCNNVKKMHRCNYCNFETQYKANLLRHIKAHQIKTNEPYKCPKCQGTYKWKQSLRQHQLICGFEPHLFCNFCLFKTRYMNMLRIHLKLHHMNKIKDLESIVADIKKKGLKIIEKRNTSSTDSCGTAQNELSNLIKLYCSKCDKTVKPQKRNINCRKCQTELTFECKKCNKRCVKRSSLFLHIRRCHMKNIIFKEENNDN